MTLRLSTLFETRCTSIRQTYVASSFNDVHWTRGKTRKQYNSKQELNGSPVNDTMGYNSIDNKTSCTSLLKKENSLPLNIDQFIVKRPTRATTRSTKAVSVNGKGSGSRIKTENESPASSSSETYSESEEDVRESSASETEAVAIKSSPQKTRRNSSRVRRKKRQYGFDSEDEEQTCKKKKKLKYAGTGKTKRGRGRDGKSMIANVGINRSSRSRTTVNYCEDDFDDFDVILPQDDEEEHKSSSDAATRSSSSDNDAPAVGGISSRGRVRKAATRFSDFVDK